MPEVKSGRWFIEFYGPYEAHMHGVRKYLVTEETDYQFAEILITQEYGKTLILDGRTQSTEVDEFIYHEALVQPAMITHPEPQRVLIIGGAEGATLREVLRHRTVKEAIMVDIDQKVVELCKKYLPEWHQGAFDDPRTKALYLDGRKYLSESSQPFDVVIMDITEPIEHGPSYLLYTREFYQIVCDHLTEEGVIVVQAGSTSLRFLYLHSVIYRTLATVFPVVRTYQAFIPSFDLPWGFALACKNDKLDPVKLTEKEVNQCLKERGVAELKFYDGHLHNGLFKLPKNLRTALSQQLDIIEDDKPVFAVL